MILEKFVQTLLPNFTGENVENSLKALRVECEDKTYPPFRSCVEMGVFAGSQPFKNSWVNTFNSLLVDGIKVNKRDIFKPLPRDLQKNSLYLIERILAAVPERINDMIRMSNINTGRIVSKVEITYPQANIIRLAELLEFFQVFARKLLLQIYAKEHESLSDKTNVLSEPLSPLEVKWLETHYESFIILLNVFSVNKEDFVRTLSSIPDIAIDENEEVQAAVRANAGARTDPFMLGIIPYTWNPIYHIRMGLAEWRKARLDAAYSERELLELRLELIRAKQAGEPNAKLEDSIERMQNRLKKLNVKIIELENSFKETK